MITSDRKRVLPPREIGGVTPSQSGGGSACARAPLIAAVGTGLRWDGLSVISSGGASTHDEHRPFGQPALSPDQGRWTAARMVSNGASSPVHLVKEREP